MEKLFVSPPVKYYQTISPTQIKKFQINPKSSRKKT